MPSQRQATAHSCLVCQNSKSAFRLLLTVASQSDCSSCSIFSPWCLQEWFLGTRAVDSTGKAGPYHWMTYSQVCTRPHTPASTCCLCILGLIQQCLAGRRGTHSHRLRPGETRHHSWAVSWPAFCQLQRFVASPARVLSLRLGLYRKDMALHSSMWNIQLNMELSHADWVLVDGACHAYSFIAVPLYDTLGADAVQYIIKHAELAAIACSVAVFPTLMQALPECPGVKVVVWAPSVPMLAPGLMVPQQALRPHAC